MTKGNAFRWAALRKHAGCPIALLVLAACAPPPLPFPELPRLGVSTQITSRNMCGLGVSPAIGIADAPAATAHYRIRITNVDVLLQEPWQVTVPAAPGGYREGALPGYEGPCLGERRLYTVSPYLTYRVEALALDAQERPLAYGQIAVLVQSISETLEQERAARERGVSPPPPLPPPGVGNPFVNPALYPRLPNPIYEP